jgi:hypothetical protein
VDLADRHVGDQLEELLPQGAVSRLVENKGEFA